MKKTITVFLVAMTICTPGYTQLKQEASKTNSNPIMAPIEVLSNNANQVIAFLDSNKPEQAMAQYRTIVLRLLGELNTTEQRMVMAKGTPDEKRYADVLKKQSNIYGEVLGLRDDLQAGKDKLP